MIAPATILQILRMQLTGIARAVGSATKISNDSAMSLVFLIVAVLAISIALRRMMNTSPGVALLYRLRSRHAGSAGQTPAAQRTR